MLNILLVLMLSYHCFNNELLIHSRRLLSDYYVSVAIVGDRDIVMSNIKIKKNSPGSYI